MDPELAALIKETHRIAKENHRILRVMRIEAWLGFLSHFALWLVIIVGSLWFYDHYLAQYLGSLPSATQFKALLQQHS